MENKWDKVRVLQYIDDCVEESSTLDYKAADALGKNDGKKKEITKDISAMANSAGASLSMASKNTTLRAKNIYRRNWME